MKQAIVPVSWIRFQSIMAQLGYEMISHDTKSGGVIFRLRQGTVTEGLKNPVTVAAPDCMSSDGITPVYEKDYVIDLITMIAGGNGGISHFTFAATRDEDC
jgi:hypothetical protein